MALTKVHKGDNAKLEFNLVLSVTFTIFLVAIAFSRLLPRRWRWNVSGHDDSEPIVKAAKHAAYNSIPFAFM